MLEPGDTIVDGRYVVRRPLGEGGMGAVYLADDTKLRRQVALKVIDRAATWAEDILREARAAALLSHPGVVRIYDVGEDDGRPFIAMEYVRGHTLREHIERGDAPFDDRLRWLSDVAEVLAEAHKNGLVHRDIKPDNLLVTEKGDVKVLDFGIARRAAGQVDPSAPTIRFDSGDLDETAQTVGEDPSTDGVKSLYATLTQDGSCAGTPGYMAPEAIRDEALDGRADQFAWGVVAYEIFSGKHPFSGAGVMARLAVTLNHEPEPLGTLCPDLPKATADVVMRSLRKQREERFVSMEALLEALSTAEGTDAPKANHSTRPSRVAGKAAIAVFIMAASGLAISFGLSNEPPTPSPPSVQSTHGAFAANASLHALVFSFKNETRSTAHDWLRQGLAESLASKLDVLAGIDAETKPSTPLVEETGAITLHVSGSYRVSDDRLSISIQIHHKRTDEADTTVATASREGPITDLFLMENELVAELAIALRGGIRDDDRERIANTGTTSLQALAAYATGLGELDNGEVANALISFQRAIDLDPDYQSCAITLRDVQAHANHIRFLADGTMVKTGFEPVPLTPGVYEWTEQTNIGRIVKAWSVTGDVLDVEETKLLDGRTFAYRVAIPPRRTGRRGVVYQLERPGALKQGTGGDSQVLLDQFTTSQSNARTTIYELPKNAVVIAATPVPLQVTESAERIFLMVSQTRDAWLPSRTAVWFAQDDVAAGRIRGLTRAEAEAELPTALNPSAQRALASERLSTEVCLAARRDTARAQRILDTAEERPDALSIATARACILNEENKPEGVFLTLTQALESVGEPLEPDERVNHAIQLLVGKATTKESQRTALRALRAMYRRVGVDDSSPYDTQPSDEELRGALKADQLNQAARYELVLRAAKREMWKEAAQLLEQPEASFTTIPMRLARAEVAIELDGFTQGIGVPGALSALGHAWPPLWHKGHRAMLVADAGRHDDAFELMTEALASNRFDPPAVEALHVLARGADGRTDLQDRIIAFFQKVPQRDRGIDVRLEMMALTVPHTRATAVASGSMRSRLLQAMEDEIGSVSAEICNAACQVVILEPLCKVEGDPALRSWLDKRGTCPDLSSAQP